MEIDPSVKHSFSLLNFPDSRFGGNGTTTVDSFIVTIQGDGEFLWLKMEGKSC